MFNKTKNYLMTLMMIAALVESSQFANAAATSLSDIKGHWAETAIAGATDKGYVDGYPDGTFRPDGKVTRAEFIKMIDTALHISVIGGAADKWYLPYLDAAHQKGFLQQNDFTSGDWDTPLTRKEMARIAVRSATGDKNTDDQKWMYLATKAGLITGLDKSGTLGEDETTDRAQAVTIIERILSIKAGTVFAIDRRAVSRAEVAWHRTNITTMLPRYFGKPIREFNPDALDFTSDNGNVKATAKEVVVVDLDDPNDPYRSYIPNDLQWVSHKDGKYRDINSGAYVLVAINRLTLEKKYGITPLYYKSGIAMTAKLVSENPSDDPSVLDASEQLYSKSRKGDFQIEMNYAGHEWEDLRDQEYINGFVIPKGNLVVEKNISNIGLRFSQLQQFGGKPVEVVLSIPDKNYNQN